MSFFAEDKQWDCGRAGTVNLHRVGSIVRDIGEPCLNPSPFKMNKMLKPEKWQATFDGDGKNFGFQKALKLIILGGVDPSIRAEVWEFLLGCYALSSTKECRKQLRNARREWYGNLIKQCQLMHSSIGTGSLAYVVGSKVMDMRMMTRDRTRREVEAKSRHELEDGNELANKTALDNCTDTLFEKESSSGSSDLVSVRKSSNVAACDSSSFLPSSSLYSFTSAIKEMDIDVTLPLTDSSEKRASDIKGCEFHENRLSSRGNPRFRKQYMHTFRICNNEDLVMESSDSTSNCNLSPVKGETKLVHGDMHGPLKSMKMEYRTEIVNGIGISDVTVLNGTISQEASVGEKRVSEWLWTLHQIVVDVVRTDNHLEFYEDTKNFARMSDILAVYAWVYPATGYCQGMSDLLSPFIVLFDNDADAFWCFEMLLRRMHDHFQIEGPIGVMRQLQSLWRILELTDEEMFAHFSKIGAESLHFAFRMLLVLFRRELSFSEALSMWEMIWAADFKKSVACSPEENCLESLGIQMPKDLSRAIGAENIDNGSGSVKDGLQPNQQNRECTSSENSETKSQSNHPFCGLTRHFWPKNERLNISTQVPLTRNGDADLPVFCVAAILIMNRHRLIKETNSIDDLIKIFNDGILTIRVKRCVHTAIKLRKKYFYKLIKRKSAAGLQNDYCSS